MTWSERLKGHAPWLAVGSVAALAVMAAGIRFGGQEEGRQAEIERMLSGLDRIVSAKVMLSDSGAASVTVTRREGDALDRETAAAIAGLVSSAVPGLAPSNVTVVDAADPGRTHRMSADAEVAYEGAAVLRLKSDVERALADKIRALFAGMQIECVAVVSVELDLDAIDEELIDYDPNDRGEFVVREERGTGSPGDSAAAAVTAANRPASLSPSFGSGARTETRSTESVIGRLTRQITRSPRGIADVTASVVVFDRLRQNEDGAWFYDHSVGERTSEYGRLVENALGGADVARVAIQYMPSPWASPPAAAEPGSVWPLLFAALGALTASLVAFKVTRRQKQPLPLPAVSEHPADGDIRRQATEAVEADAERAAATIHKWLAKEGAQ